MPSTRREMCTGGRISTYLSTWEGSITVQKMSASFPLGNLSEERMEGVQEKS